jgi:hypothetical protein
MSVEQLGRRAGAEVRQVTARDVPATSMLAELHRADGRRRRASAVIAVAVVVVIAVLGWRIAASLEGIGRLTPTGPTHGPTPTVSSSTGADGPSPCNEVVQCLGHNTYMAHIDDAVTFTLPTGWTLPAAGSSNTDFYSPISGYGVSVVEDISPPGMGPTAPAEAVARWLAARPFLTSGPVTPATLAGLTGGTVTRRLPAWQLDIQLKPDQPATGRCLLQPSKVVAGVETAPQTPCVRLLLTNETGYRSQGMWGHERLRIIVINLPNGTPAAVLIWDFTNRADMTTPASQLIDSIVFS